MNRRTSRLLTVATVALVAGGLPGADVAPAAACSVRFTRVADTTPVLPETMTAQGQSYSRHQYGDLDAGGAATTFAVGSVTYKGPRTDPETGETTIQDLGYIPLAARWDGATWSQSPIVGGDRTGQFRGVDAVAPDDAWAVGRSEPGHALFAHWDGSTWTRYSTPTASVVDASFGPAETWTATAGSEYYELSAVDMLASDDGWAVGNPHAFETPPRILHWDGVAWLSDPIGEAAASHVNPLAIDPRLTDVAVASGPSGAEVFVAGQRYDETVGQSRAFVLHRTEDGWARMATPDAPAGSVSEWSALTAITATAPDDVWAVGTWEPIGGGQQPMSLHYDGNAWTARDVAARGYGALVDVDSLATVGQTTAWATGYQEPNRRGPFGLFSQLSTSGATTATPPDALGAVAIESPTRGWAVGGDHYDTDRPILYRIRTC